MNVVKSRKKIRLGGNVRAGYEAWCHESWFNDGSCSWCYEVQGYNVYGESKVSFMTKVVLISNETKADSS